MAPDAPAAEVTRASALADIAVCRPTQLKGAAATESAVQGGSGPIPLTLSFCLPMRWSRQRIGRCGVNPGTVPPGSSLGSTKGIEVWASGGAILRAPHSKRLRQIASARVPAAGGRRGQRRLPHEGRRGVRLPRVQEEGVQVQRHRGDAVALQRQLRDGRGAEVAVASVPHAELGHDPRRRRRGDEASEEVAGGLLVGICSGRPRIDPGAGPRPIPNRPPTPSFGPMIEAGLVLHTHAGDEAVSGLLCGMSRNSRGKPSTVASGIERHCVLTTNEAVKKQGQAPSLLCRLARLSPSPSWTTRRTSPKQRGEGASTTNNIKILSTHKSQINHKSPPDRPRLDP